MCYFSCNLFLYIVFYFIFHKEEIELFGIKHTKKTALFIYFVLIFFFFFETEPQ